VTHPHTSRPPHATAAFAAGTLVVLTVTCAGCGWLPLGPRDDAGTRVLSPAEARQQEILRQDVSQPGDPALEARYEDINRRHFASVLPAMPVRWEAQLDDVGSLAGGTFTLEGMFGHLGRRSTILLNPSLRTSARALDRALCHEMVHAYLYSIGDSSTDHGPAFQAVLHRLADEGAFEGMAATTDERANLRGWLDRESARLDAERDDLDRLGQELARDRADLEHDVAEASARWQASRVTDSNESATLLSRRDEYDRRALDANARASRDRDDLAAFNREVDRYNLMLAYPDGLDEASAVRSKPLPASDRR
jgi:hypothetical protein